MSASSAATADDVHTYWAELGALRSAWLPAIDRVLAGPLLRGDEHAPLAKMRKRLSRAQEVLSQVEGATAPLLSLPELRKIGRDLPGIPLLAAGLRPPAAQPATALAAERTQSSSSLRADPRLLEAGAALLKSMSAAAPGAAVRAASPNGLAELLPPEREADVRALFRSHFTASQVTHAPCPFCRHLLVRLVPRRTRRQSSSRSRLAAPRVRRP